jgi:hypothetical protein
MDYFNSSSSDILTIPALDIEEILQDRRCQKPKKLSEKEILVLKEGANFIDLVERGEKIIQQTISDGSLSCDLEAINAFCIVDSASKNIYNQKLTLQLIITITKEVITRIIQIQNSEKVIVKNRDIAIARNLFYHISETPLSSKKTDLFVRS